MDIVEDLKKEHLQVERDLIELETIISSSLINYPNLLHVLKTLNILWDKHEEKEEVLFNSLDKKGYPIPVKKLLFDHGQLKKHREALILSLKTGSEDKIRGSLIKDGKTLIDKMRKHMKQEDWIYYALPKTAF